MIGRRWRARSDSSVEVALANFSLTFAKALLVFCVVLFLMINPKQGNDGTKPKAEYLVTIDWSGTFAYDVDLWMRLPNGSRVNYQNKESGVVFLERDDLGHDCAATTNNSKSVNTCEEIIVVRGIVPGEYIVALHLYSAAQSSAVNQVEPVNVLLKIERLNPSLDIVWKRTVTLKETREEQRVVRFNIEPAGLIYRFETDGLPSIVYGDKE